MNGENGEGGSIITQPFYSSSLNSSPEVYSVDDLDFSCEDLTVSLSQASLITTPLGLMPSEDFNDTEEQLECPSPETILFYEILQEFPDLKSFVCHEHFMTFAYIWLDLQYKLNVSARDTIQRPPVLNWLKSNALKIHYILISIVRSKPVKEARAMFSAFRRLKDRIEIVYQFLKIIENGRTMFNQKPLEAIAPLIDVSKDIKRDLTYFAENPQLIPLIQHDHIELKSIDDVTMNQLSNRVIYTYHILPYNTTGNNPDLVNNSLFSILGQHNESPELLQSSEHNHTSHTMSTDDLVSHIQPFMIHQHSWSMPVTPSVEFSNFSVEQFFSLPATPRYYQEDMVNTINESVMDFDDNETPSYSSNEDEEYVAESELEEYEEDDKKKRNKGKKKKSGRKGTEPRKVRTERHYSRRTATSYDAQTTHYLKTIFFDIYSNRDKLTKDQRRQIQKKTGLKPRNITYWFSNHKRRFQNSLAVYKKTVRESQGKVKTYDDFLKWRKEHGLPEEIAEEEIADIREL